MAEQARAARPPAPAHERGDAAGERRALLVVGMHRSGTSAVTRVLSLLGAALPRQLMESGENNPKGYFESQRIFALHEELLEEAGTAWDDLCSFPRAWLASPDAKRWIERMAEAVTAEFGDAPLFALKDPRVCRLVPFWVEVLAHLGVEPLFVIPVRNPIDVASSLRRAEGTADAKGMLLWLQYLLAAERDTRGHRRTFVGYDELLEDWRRVVARVERDLALSLPRAGHRAHAEVDDFLSAELRHRATSMDALAARNDVPRWVKDGYAWGLRAAAGDPPPTEILDEISAELAPAELAFGPVVGAAEIQRKRGAEELHRTSLQVARLEADLEEQSGQLTAAHQELAQQRAEIDRLAERSAELESRAKPLVEWVQSTLQWAGGLAGGGPAAKAHLAFALREIEAADLRNVPQLANAGIRLAQQAAESARVAEEADQRKAQLTRLTRDLETLRGELAAKDEELARRSAEIEALGERRVADLGHQLEAARQQVRGLWQQLAARDADLAAARHEAGRCAEEAAAVAPLRSELHAHQIELAARTQEAIARAAESEALQTALLASEAALIGREAAVVALAAHPLRRVPQQRSARLVQLLIEGTGPVPGQPDDSLGRRLARLLRWTASFRPGTRLRERAAVREIAASGLFDAEFYRNTYGDVAEGRLDPITHYVRHGAAEGRNPSAHFDTRFYLATSPDVAAAGINPLLHFLRTGGAEGRSPSRHFDAMAHLREHPVVRRVGLNPLLHWLTLTNERMRATASAPPRPDTSVAIADAPVEMHTLRPVPDATAAPSGEVLHP